MDTKALHEGYLLKNSEYRIISLLGQGGFGITYLAEQLSLSRKVAIKEFFMKENCNRDENTSEVSVPSVGSRELVAKFRQKFLREARMIAKLDNPHIVKIHDVFEENGTAYYVMEYLDGGSLVDEVKHRGPMSEQKALGYIRQVASALDYLHGMNVLHFDIKPANILIGNAGQAMLIDFGISKHYDAGGSQTSSTPVGISKGYAPLEQYQQGEISTFTPATDIYALGATLYYLLLGQTPPSASEVNEEGLGILPAHLSASVRKAIEKAMSPRRKDRPQSVKSFLSLLDGGRSESSGISNVDEETKVNTGLKRDSSSVPDTSSSPKRNSHIGLWIACSFIGIGVLSFLLLMPGKTSVPTPPAVQTGTLKISSVPSGAVLWLDGKNMVKSTPLTVENLSSGVHKVVLKLDGYEDGIKEVTISSSAHTECSIPLKKKVSSVEPPVVQSGMLKVSSTPSGASIWIDGKNTGKTTPEVLEDLSVGNHTVLLKLSGYRDGNKSVVIAFSRRSECDINLVKESEVVRTGTLKVFTEPSGASIWIDGKNTGKTTPGELECIAGKHTILLKHDGYKDITRSVNIVSGRCMELPINLEINETQIFEVVETMPSFKGNMNKWLKENVKYPVLAQENGISGRVFVAFVVETDGSITDVKVVRSVHSSLDNEAVRAVKSMPKWNPGKQRNTPVRVAFTMPINFTLYNNIDKFPIIYSMRNTIECDGIYKGSHWEEPYRNHTKKFHEELSHNFNTKAFFVECSFSCPNAVPVSNYYESLVLLSFDTFHRRFSIFLSKTGNIIINTNYGDHIYETKCQYDFNKWNTLQVSYNSGKVKIECNNTSDEFDVEMKEDWGNNTISTTYWGTGNTFKGYIRNIIVGSAPK